MTDNFLAFIQNTAAVLMLSGTAAAVIWLIGQV